MSDFIPSLVIAITNGHTEIVKELVSKQSFYLLKRISEIGDVDILRILIKYEIMEWRNYPKV